MTKKVLTEREGDVLVVTIANPPINAGSTEVRAGVLAAVREADGDAAIRAVVIIGGGTTFIAGSDLREFGQPLAAPLLPEVIAAIEASTKPFVAALHGAALGGGYELALGCDLRVAQAGTVVGLPEVTLGILPGAGGTQRLPRLVGRVEGVKLVVSGERVKADRALGLGMVDAIAEGDLREDAVRRARSATKRVLGALSVPVDDDAVFEKAAAAALKSGRGRPNVAAAIESVRVSATLPMAEALRRERAAFDVARVAPDAFALRHLFFAERQSAKLPELEGVAAPDIKRIGVIGGGTMGAGIAIAALEGGYEVTLIEQDEAALQRGADRIAQYLDKRVADGKLAADKAAAKRDRLRASIDWQALAPADLVIEAVFEDLAAKQSVFQRLGQVAKPGAVLASNTSYLDLDAIAAASGRAADVVGLHFFSPAQVMRLVEVVKGRESSPTALAAAFAVAKKLKKLPVLTGNAFGFIGNRLYAAYRRQCEFLLEEGAYPEDVDQALRDWGFAMGPFAVGDMSGLDIAWRMRQSLAATRDPADRYVSIPDRLCEAGRLGRKTGAGYYRYDEGKAVTDPQVHALIDEARAAKGITPRRIEADEIVRRAVLAMVNEAGLLLAEGIARQAEDIDLVLVNGYGFPRWQGGPVWFARQRGLEGLERDLDGLAEASGPGFVRADAKRLMAT